MLARYSPHDRVGARQGFTLVEMLVAVALVLLLMSMFAQVFQIAGDSISKQRGIAENDQRSRTLQNILKGDLDKRTFRLIVPWANQEDGTLPEAMAPQRQGYFYYSENDPASEIDDFLQFTVNANVVTKSQNFDAFTGRATLIGTQILPDPTNAAQRNRLLYNEPNQPEADDGLTTSEDGASSSPAAEVAYFLRNGNLYRRVLLIRQPLQSTGASNAQPQYDDNGTDRDAFDYSINPPTASDPPAYPSAGSFWLDFDYSAFPVTCLNNSSLAYARFHGIDDLNNSSIQTQFPLGNPRWRFGHHPATGRSREWNAGDSSATFYVGRLTHEETSHAGLTYPHGYAGGNPMQATYVDSSPNDGVIDAYANGPRRGEDLLMSNVHGFDIKIWDELANAFVDIGSTAAGYFGASYRQAGATGASPTYGPVGVAAVDNVLDTWHPGSSTAGISLDLSGNGSIEANEQNLPPPYRLRVFRPENEHNDWTDTSPTTLPGGASRQNPHWEPNRTYNVGDYVFPPYFPPGDTNESQSRLPRHTRFYYRLVDVTTGTGSGQSAATLADQPLWPTSPGQRILDNECLWEAVDNWRPLKAIQITVRFFDIPSDQMRQMTVIHSLVD